MHNRLASARQNLITFLSAHITAVNNAVCGFFLAVAFACALGSWFGGGDMDLIVPALGIGFIFATIGWSFAPNLSRRTRIIWVMISGCLFVMEGVALQHHFHAVKEANEPQTDTPAPATHKESPLSTAFFDCHLVAWPSSAK
jgi:hypothetical protein